MFESDKAICWWLWEMYINSDVLPIIANMMGCVIFASMISAYTLVKINNWLTSFRMNIVSPEYVRYTRIIYTSEWKNMFWYGILMCSCFVFWYFISLFWLFIDGNVIMHQSDTVRWWVRVEINWVLVLFDINYLLISQISSTLRIQLG